MFIANTPNEDPIGNHVGSNMPKLNDFDLNEEKFVNVVKYVKN